MNDLAVPLDSPEIKRFQKMNRLQRTAAVESDQLDTAINSFETAFRMQQAAPDSTELDHEKLTHRQAGRDFRLTDVHGKVVNEILT
ncbi:MAG: hypothetical protein ACKVHO_09910 [Verrucomicrobiia bacterium]|jgi:hypothetical protein